MVWLFCVLLLLTMLGRAAFVFPFSMLHNACSREQLSFKEMIVIWCVASCGGHGQPRAPLLPPSGL